MTTEQALKRAAVAVAYAERKTVQARDKKDPLCTWIDWHIDDQGDDCHVPTFFYSKVEWRIKPELWTGYVFLNKDGKTIAACSKDVDIHAWLVEGSWRAIKVQEMPQ